MQIEMNFYLHGICQLAASVIVMQRSVPCLLGLWD
jgi:hypothetical protein